MNDKRVVNFDLLRCMCMLMIVGLHFFTHGLFGNPSNFQETDMNLFCSYDRSIRSFNFLLSEYVFTIFCISVNCFVLISGYFMAKSRLKVKRIVGIYLQTFFYSLLIPILLGLFTSDDSLLYMLEGLTPICSNTYWFVTIYLGLMVISPFLISWMNQMEKTTYRRFLIIFGLINITLIWKFPWGSTYGGGTSLLFFIFLFFVGGYIRLFDISWGKGHYLKYFLLASLFIYALTIAYDFALGIKYQTGPYHVISSYNSFPFFLSVLAFLWVKDIKIDNKFLSSTCIKISPYVLGVYLISDHPLVRQYLWGMFDWHDLLSKPYFIAIMLMSCMVIFILCIIIDYLRSVLFNLMKVDQLIDLSCERIKKIKYLQSL